jgi:hypothetical protein
MPNTSQASDISNIAMGLVARAATVRSAMPSVWQETSLHRQFCHSWLNSDDRIISVMTILLLLAFIAAVVFMIERHHRQADSAPHARHGADSSIEFTHLDHDFDRVLHDVDARPAV